VKKKIINICVIKPVWYAMNIRVMWKLLYLQ